MNNYPVSELKRLPAEEINEYWNTLRHLKPSAILRGVTAIPYGEHSLRDISETRNALACGELYGIIEAVATYWQMTVEQVGEVTAVNFFAALNHLTEESAEAMKAEAGVLSKAKGSSGSGVFDKYKEYNYCFLIGKFFSCSPMSVFSWKYDDVMVTVSYVIDFKINDKYK